jgi:hypothetical protein
MSKKQFNWMLESSQKDLVSKYSDLGIEIDLEALERWHWKSLWEIYREHLEHLSGNSSELDAELDTIQAMVQEVLLEAHGTCSEEQEFSQQMSHYMNSHQYDD